MVPGVAAERTGVEAIGADRAAVDRAGGNRDHHGVGQVHRLTGGDVDLGIGRYAVVGQGQPGNVAARQHLRRRHQRRAVGAVVMRHAHIVGAADAPEAGDVAGLRGRDSKFAPLYDCKRLFVQRYVTRAIKPDAVGAEPAVDVGANPSDGVEAWELAFAVKVRGLVGAEFKVDKPTPEVEALAKYAAWALHSPDGKRRHRDGPLFKVPHKLDFEHLVPIETEMVDGITRMKLPRPMLRHREGFALTDEGFDAARALDHANYCIWCHNQGKDSCSKGLKDRKTGAFQKSPFGVTLAGCPLEEKISEMNLLKSEGFSVGALAIAAVDNPLLAATGHRICNDCMKACIYQKQEPVDIPQIETRTLKDVLGLPWGFEIYSLLTRWNPLNLRRPIPRPATGRSVLVVGLGPAGFNLAHHLMNDGHTVVGIDGLKIEPLPPGQSGVEADGKRVPFDAVRDVGVLREDLGEEGRPHRQGHQPAEPAGGLVLGAQHHGERQVGVAARVRQPQLHSRGAARRRLRHADEGRAVGTRPRDVHRRLVARHQPLVAVHQRG